MKTVELTLNGMTCGHCVMSLKKELGKVNGLIVHDVQIGIAKLEYDEQQVQQGAILAAVEEAGFDLVEEKNI